MKQITEIASGISFKKEKTPPHELAAAVDLIKESGVMTKKYGYKYYLRIVKKSGKSYTDMLGIIKEMQSLPDKYNKGGWLTNQLK